MGPEYNYMNEAGGTLSKVETAPDSDAKVIRQQVIDITETIREVRYQLEDVAGRFWGSVPSEATTSDKPEISGDTLRGVNQEFDEARSELSRLRRAAERFRRLA